MNDICHIYCESDTFNERYCFQVLSDVRLRLVS